MEVPRSPALRLRRYDVLSGRLALLVQVVAKSLPKTPVVLIQLGRVGHVCTVCQRHPQGPCRVGHVCIDDVPQGAEALRYTGQRLSPVLCMPELLDLSRPLVEVQIC